MFSPHVSQADTNAISKDLRWSLRQPKSEIRAHWVPFGRIATSNTSKITQFARISDFGCRADQSFGELCRVVNTVNTRYRHTRYMHSLVIGTKTRVYQLSPAKTSSLWALAHHVTGTQTNHFVPITSCDVIQNVGVSGYWREIIVLDGGSGPFPAHNIFSTLKHGVASLPRRGCRVV